MAALTAVAAAWQCLSLQLIFLPLNWGTFAIYSAILAILVIGRCACAVTQVIYFMKYDWFVAVTAAWSKLARKKMLS